MGMEHRQNKRINMQTNKVVETCRGIGHLELYTDRFNEIQIHQPVVCLSMAGTVAVVRWEIWRSA